MVARCNSFQSIQLLRPFVWIVLLKSLNGLLFLWWRSQNFLDQLNVNRSFFSYLFVGVEIFPVNTLIVFFCSAKNPVKVVMTSKNHCIRFFIPLQINSWKLGPERTSKINIVGKEEVERSFYGQLVLGEGVASSLDEQLTKEAQKAGEHSNSRNCILVHI